MAIMKKFLVRELSIVTNLKRNCKELTAARHLIWYSLLGKLQILKTQTNKLKQRPKIKAQIGKEVFGAKLRVK